MHTRPSTTFLPATNHLAAPKPRKCHVLEGRPWENHAQLTIIAAFVHNMYHVPHAQYASVEQSGLLKCHQNFTVTMHTVCHTNDLINLIKWQ